ETADQCNVLLAEMVTKLRNEVGPSTTPTRATQPANGRFAPPSAVVTHQGSGVAQAEPAQPFADGGQPQPDPLSALASERTTQFTPMPHTMRKGAIGSVSYTSSGSRPASRSLHQIPSEEMAELLASNLAAAGYFKAKRYMFYYPSGGLALKGFPGKLAALRDQCTNTSFMSGSAARRLGLTVIKTTTRLTSSSQPDSSVLGELDTQGVMITLLPGTPHAVDLPLTQTLVVSDSPLFDYLAGNEQMRSVADYVTQYPTAQLHFKPNIVEAPEHTLAMPMTKGPESKNALAVRHVTFCSSASPSHALGGGNHATVSAPSSDSVPGPPSNSSAAAAAFANSGYTLEHQEAFLHALGAEGQPSGASSNASTRLQHTRLTRIQRKASAFVSNLRFKVKRAARALFSPLASTALVCAAAVESSLHLTTEVSLERGERQEKRAGKRKKHEPRNPVPRHACKGRSWTGLLTFALTLFLLSSFSVHVGATHAQNTGINGVTLTSQLLATGGLLCSSASRVRSGQAVPGLPDWHAPGPHSASFATALASVETFSSDGRTSAAAYERYHKDEDGGWVWGNSQHLSANQQASLQAIVRQRKHTAFAYSMEELPGDCGDPFGLDLNTDRPIVQSPRRYRPTGVLFLEGNEFIRMRGFPMAGVPIPETMELLQGLPIPRSSLDVWWLNEEPTIVAAATAWHTNEQVRNAAAILPLDGQTLFNFYLARLEASFAKDRKNEALLNFKQLRQAKDGSPSMFLRAMRLLEPQLGGAIPPESFASSFMAGLDPEVRFSVQGKYITVPREDWYSQLSAIAADADVVWSNVQHERLNRPRNEKEEPPPSEDQGPGRHTPASNSRQRTFQCDYHGHNQSHASSDCFVLQQQGSGQQSRAPGRGTDNRRRDGATTTGFNRTLQCSYCARLGHDADNCLIRFPDRVSEGWLPPGELLKAQFLANKKDLLGKAPASADKRKAALATLTAQQVPLPFEPSEVKPDVYPPPRLSTRAPPAHAAYPPEPRAPEATISFPLSLTSLPLVEAVLAFSHARSNQETADQCNVLLAEMVTKLRNEVGPSTTPTRATQPANGRFAPPSAVVTHQGSGVAQAEPAQPFADGGQPQPDPLSALASERTTQFTPMPHAMRQGEIGSVSYTSSGPRPASRSLHQIPSEEMAELLASNLAAAGYFKAKQYMFYYPSGGLALKGFPGKLAALRDQCANTSLMSVSAA
ncbi:hypothetical protein TSOC_013459, partial [Tetrabaena socialis]